MDLRLPKAVTLVEVGLRDGLQSVGHMVPTATKVRLLQALYAAGVRAMEVTSFVSPKAVSQFTDAEEVARAALALPGLRVSALIPNLRGWERARGVGVREVTVVIGATDRFNMANVRMTVDQSLAQLAGIMEAVGAEPGVAVEVGIAVAFGCPYTGRVPLAAVRRIIDRSVELGVGSVSLADTIGVATPLDVVAGLTGVRAACPNLPLSLHLHDTRGMGLANALAALHVGVTTFDGAVGGLGGCPFAPGATGNVATDDLNNMLTGMGIATGINQDGLLACGGILHDEVTVDLPSHALRVFLGQATGRGDPNGVNAG